MPWFRQTTSSPHRCPHSLSAIHIVASSIPKAAAGELRGIDTASGQSLTHVRVKVVKRIPKGVTYQCKMKLTSILKSVVRNNDLAIWDLMFQFPTWCLKQPHQRPRFPGPTLMLTSRIGNQLNENSAPVNLSWKSHKKKVQNKFDPLSLACLVSSKIEYGDLKGAIHVASSEDTLASFDDETYEALCSKRSPCYLDSFNPSPPTPE